MAVAEWTMVYGRYDELVFEGITNQHSQNWGGHPLIHLVPLQDPVRTAAELEQIELSILVLHPTFIGVGGLVHPSEIYVDDLPPPIPLTKPGWTNPPTRWTWDEPPSTTQYLQFLQASFVFSTKWMWSLGVYFWINGAHNKLNHVKGKPDDSPWGCPSFAPMWSRHW